MRTTSKPKALLFIPDPIDSLTFKKLLTVQGYRSTFKELLTPEGIFPIRGAGGAAVDCTAVRF
jgi:hypothetical protein